MFAFTFIALLVVFATCSYASNTGDLYVFAYSWTPQYCYGKKNYSGCMKPQAFWGTHFTMHGLWPQYSAGGYPSFCTTEAFNSSVPVAVGWSDMTTYWPDAEYAETDPMYDSFWDHEWTKHGTCSGLAQQTYFQDTINLIKSFGTPSSVTNNVGKTVDAATIRNEMGGPTYASLQCDSGKYLSGVYTCWTTVNGVPTKQTVCPADVQKEDTCTSSTVSITSF